MNILHPVWAEINIDNIIYNIKNIQAKAKNSHIIGVVKANAYGHGASMIAKVLVENGVERLAVSSIIEAIELRENNITAPIMILGISEPFSIDALLDNNVEVTVSSYEFASKLNTSAKKMNKVVKIHIAIDTGMGRIGFKPCSSSIDEIINISKLSNLEIESIFSHFSTADEEDKSYSQFQLSNYKYFETELSKYSISLGHRNIANSAAIIDIPESHFYHIRPGIIQYGYYPSNDVNKNNLSLKPALTWKTSIVHIKEVEANEHIGYGRKFTTTRKTKIATLPVGYADGYSRNLSNKGKVIINGQIAPIIGSICMDQCMIDITDLDNVYLYDEVILLGSEKNVKFDADDMANILGTINYEVLCLIGRRIPRVYIKNNEVISIIHFM